MLRDGPLPGEAGHLQPAGQGQRRPHQDGCRARPVLAEPGRPADRPRRLLPGAAGARPKAERANLKKGEPGKAAKERAAARRACGSCQRPGRKRRIRRSGGAWGFWAPADLAPMRLIRLSLMLIAAFVAAWFVSTTVRRIRWLRKREYGGSGDGCRIGSVSVPSRRLWRQGRGALKSFTTEPNDIATYSPSDRGRPAASVRLTRQNGARLPRLSGVETREAAEAPKGVALGRSRQAAEPARRRILPRRSDRVGGP